jgi:hypothetical protein
MRHAGKAVVGLFGLGLVVVGGVTVRILMQPEHIHVERSIEVDAAPVDVAGRVRDLREVTAWSPWTDLDPDMEQSYSHVTTGTGAWYAWKGDDDVGSGRQEVLVDEPRRVVHELVFVEPMESRARATITWRGDAERTVVTWAFDQPADLVSKAFTLFVDVDGRIGADLARGLERLEERVEADRAARVVRERRVGP